MLDLIPPSGTDVGTHFGLRRKLEEFKAEGLFLSISHLLTEKPAAAAPSCLPREQEQIVLTLCLPAGNNCTCSLPPHLPQQGRTARHGHLKCRTCRCPLSSVRTTAQLKLTCVGPHEVLHPAVIPQNVLRKHRTFKVQLVFLTK